LSRISCRCNRRRRRKEKVEQEEEKEEEGLFDRWATSSHLVAFVLLFLLAG
jgi:hypothetical protein